jgi:hypothetical protein
VNYEINYAPPRAGDKAALNERQMKGDQKPNLPAERNFAVRAAFSPACLFRSPNAAVRAGKPSFYKK